MKSTAYPTGSVVLYRDDDVPEAGLVVWVDMNASDVFTHHVLWSDLTEDVFSEAQLAAA